MHRTLKRLHLLKACCLKHIRYFRLHIVQSSCRLAEPHYEDETFNNFQGYREKQDQQQFLRDEGTCKTHPFYRTTSFTPRAAAALEEMKFGKKLKIQIQETLPEWQDKFLCYKDLKKLVRLISSVPSVTSTLARRRFSNDQSSLEKVDAEFVYLLNVEIEKFNAFFMEQEEDFIIRHEELQQRIQRVIATLGPDGSQPSEKDYKEEMERIRNDIVNFHGEMVLLENYSNINYTGLAKILKKYDKRTGGILRLPFIQSVLQQPFFTTDLVSKLVKECESTIEAIFSTLEEEEEVEEGRKGTTTVVGLEGGIIFRNTIAALVTMKEMRRSSTYSQFSLPPLNLPESDIILSLQLNSAIPIL